MGYPTRRAAEAARNELLEQSRAERTTQTWTVARWLRHWLTTKTGMPLPPPTQLARLSPGGALHSCPNPQTAPATDSHMTLWTPTAHAGKCANRRGTCRLDHRQVPRSPIRAI